MSIGRSKGVIFSFDGGSALGVARAMKLIVTALTAIAMWAIYVGVWERRIERQPAAMELASFEQQEYLKYLESIGDRECY